MPELPEVETTRRGIYPHIEGQTIRTLVVREPRLRWPVPAKLPDLVAGARILSVARRGKYLLLGMAQGSILIHLGMSGSLRILAADTPPAKHDHVDLVLENGRLLRLTDPRRFGAVLWQPAGEEHPLLASLGPEPLSEAFNGDYLHQHTKGRRSAIKSVLMNSHVVVGVGNIYANEALFMAGIDPRRAAGRISRQRLDGLVEAVKTVLKAAIEQGGTTLRDFVGGDGKPGYFAQQLHVYGRAGQPCPQCHRVLKEVRLNQRSTVFCPHCQS